MRNFPTVCTVTLTRKFFHFWQEYFAGIKLKLHGLSSNRLFTCWDKDIMEILALTAVENHHQSHNATLIGVNHLTIQINRYSDTDKTDIVLFN